MWGTVALCVLFLVVVALLLWRFSIKINNFEKSISNTNVATSSISQLLPSMMTSFEKISSSVIDQGTNTGKMFGEISQRVERLNAVLTNQTTRGSWGQRMVEDIINLIGLKEGINYQKQEVTESGKRPDFVFFLPNSKKINLDAKFPLDYYARYIEAKNETERDGFKKEFTNGLKGMIRDVSKRGYINNDTVDFAMIFIANEGAYSFLFEAESSIMDEAMKNKIVLCSPTTLYATLSVIRQATEYYMIEKASRDILSLLGDFKNEWLKFVEQFESIDINLRKAREAFDAISTTRRDKLERVLTKIESFKSGPEDVKPQ